MYKAQILQIYYHPFSDNAPTIYENVRAFKKYSNFDVININAHNGFPSNLYNINFQVILLHYSSFLKLSEQFYAYLKQQNNSTVVAFYQDEHINCQKRFNLINDLNVKVIFTQLDSDFHKIYTDNTNAKEIYHHLTGYVEDDMIKLANQLEKPQNQRKIDIGYRGRPLPFFNGKGAQEKTEIGTKFTDYAKGKNLTVDVKTGENDRIYGNNWHEFVANCKAMLGVEAGVSIFDIDGKAEKASKDFLLGNPNASFEEVHRAVLHPFEDKVFYRTISPRIFECAAFKTCMILFEGKYNDIIKPDIHYIPLKKDFSNIDEVMLKFKDLDKRMKMIDASYQDLILSQKHSYQNFIKKVDQVLSEIIGKGQEDLNSPSQIIKLIDKDKKWRFLRIKTQLFLIKFYHKLPFRKIIKLIMKPFFNEKKYY